MVSVAIFVIAQDLAYSIEQGSKHGLLNVREG
jgi:hypothetical protein